MNTPAITPNKNSGSRNTQPALKRFVAVLEFLDKSGVVEELNESHVERFDDARMLFNEGMVSGYDSSTLNGRAISDAAITPKGAVALYEWSQITYRHSIRAKMSAAFWIVASVLGTILVQR